MKTKNLLMLVLLYICLSLCTTPLFSQKYDDPLQYMEDINNEYETLIKETWQYVKTIGRGRSDRRISKKRGDLLDELKRVKNTIKKMPAYEENTSLRDSIVSYLNTNYLVLKNDFDKILDMEEIAEQSYDMMEAYILARKKANEKLSYAADRAINEQKKFADEYNITLVDNDDRLSNKLKQSNKVFDYYDKVYLIFFKSYKQEFYMLEAQQNKDINALEQNRVKLKEFAEEGLEQLKEIKAYKSDMSLNYACRDMLRFYVQESGDRMKEVASFIMKKERFEKMTKAFETKKKSELTQGNIDKYNNAVNDYNASIRTYNKTNEQLTNLRNKYLSNWNKTAEDFLKKHTP